MERLLEIDGAIEFFLMIASMNVNWEGCSTDIVGDRLIAVAAIVNRKFGTDLNCFDIKFTWNKLRALWETWVRVGIFVPLKGIHFTTGEINLDDFAWNQLVRIVPDAEIFRRKKMISPNMVCTVFNRTPPSLAPEPRLKRLKPSEDKEEDWNACIALANSIDQLRLFETLFKDREILRCFNLLPNKTLKYEYFVMQYNLRVSP
ncbi:hypothetical protein CMV_018316 [Castanea mollissima]|uniref:Uncharacterized protein n=1 Tax=Castanea mollissima TaxID=60419 RepID=A0A8J4QND6_9ROSI|nr:hypothetical protein CMV_018316 [Castanea mollissima]